MNPLPEFRDQQPTGIKHFDAPAIFSPLFQRCLLRRAVRIAI
jgi:hypothetical protein